VSRRSLRRGNWSVQEVQRLRRLLPDRGLEECARLLRRSVASVRARAVLAMAAEPRRDAWTEAEDQFLRRAWGMLDPRMLGALLGRPALEVRKRASLLRQQVRTGAWSREEMQSLRRAYGSRSDGDLEVCLARPVPEIEDMAAVLCLAKDKRSRQRVSGARRRMPRWSPQQMAELSRIYPDLDNLEVARRLGRTVLSVANKAHQLGLRKTSAVLGRIGRRNVRVRHDRGRTAGPATHHDASGQD
jgi:hypothetical protein